MSSYTFGYHSWICGFAALKGEAGGEFLPLVVDNFGVWTPSSIEILHSITKSSTVRNGLSTSNLILLSD